MPAPSVDKVHNPVGFIEVSINAAIFNLSLQPRSFAAGGACLNAYLEMPTWIPVEREQQIFGPDTIAVLAVALEDTLRQLRLANRNDPAVSL
jgi:hypothetical protein